LGAGWRLSYQTRLVIDKNSHGQMLQVDQADGALLTFNRNIGAVPEGADYFGASPQQGRIRLQTIHSSVYYLR
jgi:hypothetical protein